MTRPTMRAAVYFGPDDIRVGNWPVPEIGPGDVLLRVLAASICGTDLRILHGHHRKYGPDSRRVPGHEIVGDVIKVGPGVVGVEIGSRYFVAPNMGCGKCDQCVTGNNNRCLQLEALGVTCDGGFAEFVKIPAKGVNQGCLIPFPKENDPAVGTLIEPLACVLRAQEAIRVGMGDHVLIIGAGPIGMMHLKLAKVRGAAKVIISEMVDYRREQALTLGADRVIDPINQNLQNEILDETGGKEPDVVIVAAPSPKAQEQAIQLAAVGGRISFFGGLPKDRPMINCNSNLIHYKELMVSGTSASSTDNCCKAARLIESGAIDLVPLISARFPLSEIQKAMDWAERGNSLKTVIIPGEG